MKAIDVWDYPPTSLFGSNPFKAEFTLRSEERGDVIREKLSVLEKREIEKSQLQSYICWYKVPSL